MAKKDSRQRDYVHMLVRMPPDLKAWIEQQADQSLGSQNSEVVRALRAQMKVQAAREAEQA